MSEGDTKTELIKAALSELDMAQSMLQVLADRLRVPENGCAHAVIQMLDRASDSIGVAMWRTEG